MDDIRSKAEEYHDNALVVGAAHFISSKAASKKHLQLGLPMVITSTLVSTSIFVNLLEHANLGRKDLWALLALSLSLLAAVLGALQTFFRFAEQAAKHKASGASYGSLRRQIDIVLLKISGGQFKDRDEALRELEAIGRRLSELAEECPDVSERHYALGREQVTRENKLLLSRAINEATVRATGGAHDTAGASPGTLR